MLLYFFWRFNAYKSIKRKFVRLREHHEQLRDEQETALRHLRLLADYADGLLQQLVGAGVVEHCACGHNYPPCRVCVARAVMAGYQTRDMDTGWTERCGSAMHAEEGK